MSTMKHLLVLALSYTVLLFYGIGCSSDSNNDVIDTNFTSEVTNNLVAKDAVINPINEYFIIASVLTLLAFAFVVGLKPVGNISVPNNS